MKRFCYPLIALLCLVASVQADDWDDMIAAKVAANAAKSAMEAKWSASNSNQLNAELDRNAAMDERLICRGATELALGDADLDSGWLDYYLGDDMESDGISDRALGNAEMFDGDEDKDAGDYVAARLHYEAAKVDFDNAFTHFENAGIMYLAAGDHYEDAEQHFIDGQGQGKGLPYPPPHYTPPANPY